MRSPTSFKYRICASFRQESSVASLTPKGMRLITMFFRGNRNINLSARKNNINYVFDQLLEREQRGRQKDRKELMSDRQRKVLPEPDKL